MPTISRIVRFIALPRCLRTTPQQRSGDAWSSAGAYQQHPPGRDRGTSVAWSRLDILGGSPGERLERAQPVPGRLVVDRRHVQAQATLVYLEDALADADVDRTALGARRTALAPVAQVALGEVVFDRVVGDARHLAEAQLVGRVFLRTGGKDARFRAAVACDAHVFANEARAGSGLHAQRIDRAH